jgi:hypothetical protein
MQQDRQVEDARPEPALEFPSTEDIDLMHGRSTSHKNFAAHLMRAVYSRTERIGRNCAGKQGKLPLSPRRLSWIKRMVGSRFVPKSGASDVDILKDCVKAMDAVNRRDTRMESNTSDVGNDIADLADEDGVE